MQISVKFTAQLFYVVKINSLGKFIDSNLYVAP